MAVLEHRLFGESGYSVVGRFLIAASAACLFAFATPAMAGRTIIDEDPNGDPIKASLAGYCDFNGEDCYDSSGIVLPYQVSIGGAAFTDRVIVHGNGLLTFGAPIDFSEQPLQDAIYLGANPQPSDYGRTLISAGQSNTLAYDGTGFMQSATLGVNSATGVIQAIWFTCGPPSAPGVCPRQNAYSLTLTPVSGGFSGHFDFAGGTPETTDRGYVSAGVFTPTDSDFFLPARLLGVPEPATWAMMIVGFGLVGGALRRRRTAATGPRGLGLTA
jgi:hypothetical protein